MTYGQCTDRANTFFICILAGSYDFCRVVTAGVLTIFGSKNDSAPSLLYSKYCTAPEGSKFGTNKADIIYSGSKMETFMFVAEFQYVCFTHTYIFFC